MMGGDSSWVTSSHLGQWHGLFDSVKKKGNFFPRKKIQIFNQPSIFMAEHCNQILKLTISMFYLMFSLLSLTSGD